MEFLFWFFGVFCLAYYGVIVCYSGPSTSFAPIWLVLSACLFIIATVVHFYDRFRDRISLRLEVSAVTALTAIFVVFVCVEIAMGVNFFSLDKQSADYVIVLGAQVRGKALSRTLEYRLEKALEYARVHPNTVLVLSGGQGAGEEMTDAEAMYEYLKAHGIPESQMLLEEQSASTYENLVYSKLLIQEREAKRRQTIRDVMAASGYLSPPDEEVSIRVGIITSNFHVLRAKAIARKTGIPGITGIAAKSDPVLFLHFSVRECFAILKDKFVGNM